MDPLTADLRTDRLALRPWTPADAAALGAAIAASLEHLRRWMPWAAAEPISAPERAAWIAEAEAARQAGGDLVLGILAGATVVGGTGIKRRPDPGTLEIGYWVHVDHVGCGYASEATAALTDHIFATTDAAAVEIHHDRANVRSRAIPARLGYAFVGETPDSVTAPGEDGVDCCWRTTRATWTRRA